MPDRAPPGLRSAYRWFHALTTRWADNDQYGHINNVVYLSYFDTAITLFEVLQDITPVPARDTRCYAAEAHCRYFAPAKFPDRITVGVRIGRIGTTSVCYELAAFRNDEDAAIAEGHVIHVFVAADTERPVAIPPPARAAFAAYRGGAPP